MDAQMMIAFILYVVAHVWIAILRVKGYIKTIGFFSLMFIGFLVVNSNNMGELAYLVVGLTPIVLFLGDALFNKQ